MDSRIVLSLALLFTLVSLPTPVSTATTVDFDDVPTGHTNTIPGDSYLGAGIIFDRPIPIQDIQAADPDFAVYYEAGGGTLPNGIQLSVATPNGDLEVEAIFVIPGTSTPVVVSSVQVHAFDNQVGTILGTLVAYDTLQAVIDSVSLITPESRSGVLSISAPGIARIRLSQDSDGGSFDNLQFSGSDSDTVLDFDEITLLGSAVTVPEDWYLDVGLLFDRPIPIHNLPAIEPGFVDEIVAGGGSLPNILPLSIVGPNGDLEINVTFVIPGTFAQIVVDSVQVHAFDTEVGTILGVLEAYDVFDNLIESTSMITPPSQSGVLKITQSGIARIRLSQDADGGSFDNLTFSVPPITGVEDPDPVSVPTIIQNYPNPFQRSTTIAFTVSENGVAVLDIFSIQGKLVRRVENIPVKQGLNEIQTPRGELVSGIYFYRLAGNGFSYTRKMVVGP